MSTLFIKCLKFCAIILIFPNLIRFSNSIETETKDKNVDQWNGGVFDYVIVGAGTAGCAIARRLSEAGLYSVLLIEEGGLPHPNLEIPALSLGLAPNYVTRIPTVPQRNASLATNGTVYFLYGRTLGGSSAVNGMVLNRGHPQDYNNWGRLSNDSSWNYANMLKYLKKFEDYQGPFPSDFRGTHGPITATPPSFAPGLQQWLQAGRELEFLTGEDPNALQTVGFSTYDFAKRFGRRVSSYYGYIRPIVKSFWGDFTPAGLHHPHSNPLILINSTAKRILFENKTAIGVEFMRNSTKYHARARKEVIITAGVIGSPLLLQKSGIGPKTILEKANISLIKDLPVGQNLQDHVVVSQVIIFGNSSAVLVPERDFTEENFRKFNETGEGPYSTFIGGGGQAFLAASNLPKNESRLAWPNLHLVSTHRAGNATLAVANYPVDSNELKEGEVLTSWGIFLTRPRSRGSVSLNETDKEGTPRLDFQYLTHPADLEALVEALKFTVRLCQDTKAFQSIGCRLPTTLLSQCREFNRSSDDYWKCYARQLSTSGFHGAGACRLGSGEGDSEAVVDTQLRVIGVKGLRVADASIMPTVTNTNTQAAVYAIAEKASEMILKSSWSWSWSISPERRIEKENEFHHEKIPDVKQSFSSYSLLDKGDTLEKGWHSLHPLPLNSPHHHFKSDVFPGNSVDLLADLLRHDNNHFNFHI